MFSILRPHLATHRLRRPKSDGLFFGVAESPFKSLSVRKWAESAWSKAKLDGLGYHEARHTYAAFCVAAGINLRSLSSYMGHSSITITLDRYGHLMPGNEDEATKLADAYFAQESGPHSGPQLLRSVL